MKLWTSPIGRVFPVLIGASLSLGLPGCRAVVAVPRHRDVARAGGARRWLGPDGARHAAGLS